MTTNETNLSPDPETTEPTGLLDGLTRTLAQRNSRRLAAAMAERQKALAVYGRALSSEAGYGDAVAPTIAELEAAMKTLAFDAAKFASDVEDLKRLKEWQGPDYDQALQEKLKDELTKRLSDELAEAQAAIDAAQKAFDEKRVEFFSETSRAREWCGPLGQVAHKCRHLAARLANLGVPTGAAPTDNGMASILAMANGQGGA